MNLYRPSRDEFVELSKTSSVVPVWREVLADLQTPLAVYDRLRGAGPSFLLESVEHGERWGRWSFVGLSPFLQLVAQDGGVSLLGDAPEAAAAVAATGDPLATLETLLDALRTPDLAGLPPLFSGAVGYLGYDVVRFIERLPDTGTDDLRMADVHLVFPGQLVVFDHLRQRLLVVSNVRGGTGEAWDEAVAASEALVARLSEPVRAPAWPPPAGASVDDADANMAEEAFLSAVERAKEYIRAGDCFQVVPSQRFSVPFALPPFALYRALRRINPAPFLFFFDYGGFAAVGASPEILVRLRDGTVTVRPLAGTRRRGATPEEDRALEAELLADPKERAEHLMLLDLGRNDVGRVAAVGSMRVPTQFQVERYSQVMHIGSEVQGRLRDGLSAVDALMAGFPAGTLSGAPKVRAMEIIEELEPSRRGVYAGGFGYFGADGGMDTCIGLRTALVKDGVMHVQAGAGVVADSDPQAEFEETQQKARALFRAAEEAVRFAAGRR